MRTKVDVVRTEVVVCDNCHNEITIQLTGFLNTAAAKLEEDLEKEFQQDLHTNGWIEVGKLHYCSPGCMGG